MTYKTEFPDYDLDFKVPEGFTDQSWHNDICPHWELEREKNGLKERLELWADYKDIEKREGQLEPRFQLYYFSSINFEKGSIEDCDCSVASDNYDDILEKIKNFMEA